MDGSGDDCPVIAEGFSPGQGAHFPAHAERYLAFGDQGAELLSVFADTFRPESRFFLLPDFFPGFLFDSALLLTELKLPLVVKIAAFRDEIDRRVIFVSDFRGQRQLDRFAGFVGQQIKGNQDRYVSSSMSVNSSHRHLLPLFTWTISPVLMSTNPVLSFLARRFLPTKSCRALTK